MNRKTFALAVSFLCLTLCGFIACIYGFATGTGCVGGFDLTIALVCLVAAACMVVHEGRKKKRKHLADVNKHQIP